MKIHRYIIGSNIRIIDLLFQELNTVNRVKVAIVNDYFSRL